MWIIPKQLHTLVYAADTKELALDSEEFSQICERSLTWRGKDSLQRTWYQRWKRESWMQHLSSRTLKPSRTQSFVDAWTSSLGDSRANLSAKLEFVKELKIPGISSHTSETASENASPELFSSKTLKELSLVKRPMENQFSNMSSENWKDWVTSQRQEYSQRAKSAHLTKESGSLSWPTATSRDWKDGTAEACKNVPSNCLLGREVHKYNGHPDRAKLNTTGKSQESWPTPATRDFKGMSGKGRQERKKHPKDTLPNAVHSPKLNPDWVEQLMGLPVGWTDLGSWATESSQLQQQKPSSPSSRESYEPVQDNVH